MRLLYIPMNTIRRLSKEELTEISNSKFYRESTKRIAKYNLENYR